MKPINNTIYAKITTVIPDNSRTFDVTFDLQYNKHTSEVFFLRDSVYTITNTLHNNSTNLLNIINHLKNNNTEIINS